MIPIEDYIQKPQSDRQIHLRLSESCDERGGMSSYFKGLLAYYLNTSIPSGRMIHVCHACHNSKCSNVRHLYWGTPRENQLDAISQGRPISPYHANVEKFGIEEANRRQKRISNKNGCGNLDKPKTNEHRKKISESISNWHNEKTTPSNTGRKTIMDSTTLMNLVENEGFERGSEILGITKSALQGRYYRLTSGMRSVK